MHEDEDFCFTYGDGLSDVNITNLIAFHRSHGLQATLTATYPPGRFGAIEIQPNQLLAIQEKPKGGGMINGGFFVLSPKVLKLIPNDDTIWECGPLEALAQSNELKLFTIMVFWQPWILFVIRITWKSSGNLVSHHGRYGHESIILDWKKYLLLAYWFQRKLA